MQITDQILVDTFFYRIIKHIFCFNKRDFQQILNHFILLKIITNILNSYSMYSSFSSTSLSGKYPILFLFRSSLYFLILSRFITTHNTVTNITIHTVINDILCASVNVLIQTLLFLIHKSLLPSISFIPSP